MIITEQNRLSIADAPWIRWDLNASIPSLTRQWDALQKKKNAHIEASPELAKQNRQIQLVPDVGPQVPCRLMASMPKLGRVDRRQIASLARLAPHAHKPGLYKGKRAIHGGRNQVRSALYIAALVVIR